MIGSSSARVKERLADGDAIVDRIITRLADGDVIVVEVIGRPLLARGLLGVFDISLRDEVVVGLRPCGRLVLGAKVLSGIAQGFVRHILEDEVDWQKEEQGDQRDGNQEEEVNGGVEQSEKHTMRMNHEDGMTHEMSADSNLSHCSVMSSEQRENSQGTLTTEESTLTTKELQCMMPSCRLASELHSQIPKCFRSLHTLLGLSLCLSRYQFTCCQCT